MASVPWVGRRTVRRPVYNANVDTPPTALLQSPGKAM
jgi:hypothetical protein